MIAARSSRRLLRWLVGILAMVLASLLAPAGAAHAAPTPSPSVPIPPDQTMTDVGKGAITPADRDFVIRVRMAGLWEIAASNMAQEKSDDPRVVNIAKSIAGQHVVLDQLDRQVAKKLGIELPNQPNGDQLGWLNEMRTAATPQQFDQIYIDRLRSAHGVIFPAIATIRASTRNDSVRLLAQQSNQFVMTHMTLLESSGLVDYGALPTAPAPKVGVNRGPVPVDGNVLAAASSGRGGPGVNTTVVFLVLATALVAGLITTMRIFRTR
jgi:predicted outer membrane protein